MPSVNALVLKTNILIVVRDGTHNLVPYIISPVSSPLVFLLSLAIVLFLHLGAGFVLVSSNLPVQPTQPLGRRDLELNLHSVAECKLCIASKIYANHRFGNNPLHLCRVGSEVDVVVNPLLHQSRTSDVRILWQLVKPLHSQPLFQSLYPNPIPLNEEGLVVLDKRDGVHLALELQLPDLEPLFFQGMESVQRSPQSCSEALSHLPLKDGQISVFVFIANLDRDGAKGCVNFIHRIEFKAVVVEPLCLLEQFGQMTLNSVGKVRAVNLALKHLTGLLLPFVLCEFSGFSSVHALI